MFLITINQKFTKNFWHYLVLVILSAFFFLGVFSYVHFLQKDGFIKRDSPDETANYIFTKLYADEGKLAIFEKYNLYAGDIMHPRSMRSDAGKIKPVSFLGIILIYGKIASIVDYKIIPYLTPILASVGIIYFYLLIKIIFGRSNALISAFLLVSFPVYAYYSARSMFHNVLFVALLIMSLYYSISMAPKKNKRGSASFKEAKPLKLLYACLAGGFLGLVVITRASEILWLLPLFFVLWMFNFKKVDLVKLILFLSFLFLAILPMFYWNEILYGAPLAGGYPEMNSAIKNIASESAQVLKEGFGRSGVSYKNYFIDLKNNIFYFGFQPRQSLKMFYYYFAKMFWWLFWPAFFGFLLFLFKIKKWSKRHWAYLISYFIISLILLFYYGSWKFHDNPDPESFTIGNSYTRYWLPLYLGAMPFASMFIIKLTKLFKKRFFIAVSQVVLIILIFFVSLKLTLIGSEEGLVLAAAKINESKHQYEKVLELTENNAAIITFYHDKLFFPERKVIIGLFNDSNMLKEYAKLVNYLPVYYYNFTLPEKDFNYLNGNKLGEYGLHLEKVEKITSDFTLYKLGKRVESL
jgi:hypothetical protein